MSRPESADVALTLSEAAQRLDPPISRDTLERLVARARLLPCGHSRGGRGRRARLYRSADLDRLHAAWVRSQQHADAAGTPV